jgi:4'-phosphopantetheinyl transferase
MAGSIHLACSRVDALLREAPEPTKWLSPEELQRLDGMRSSRRRGQFVAARWQARRLLASVFGGSPADWPLDAAPDSPPTLPARSDLHLSISHSADWTACAVSFEAVGLDIEAPRPGRDIAGLAQVCCTPSEVALMQAAPDREAIFYSLWTAKEAWLKRRREWMAPSRLRQLELRPGGFDARTWSAPGWALALCGAGKVRWSSDEPTSRHCWEMRDEAASPA